jgi:hypothetical protein
MLVSAVAGMMETDYFDGGSDQWWHYYCKKSEKSELIAKEVLGNAVTVMFTKVVEKKKNLFTSDIL